jgi:hypothetical protein
MRGHLIIAVRIGNLESACLRLAGEDYRETGLAMHRDPASI